MRQTKTVSYDLRHQEALTQMTTDEKKPELKDETKSTPRLRTNIRAGALNAYLTLKGQKQGD